MTNLTTQEQEQTQNVLKVQQEQLYHAEWTKQKLELEIKGLPISRTLKERELANIQQEINTLKQAIQNAKDSLKKEVKK